MENNFYITTPIYYVNGKPHIGHSYTTIAADCLARHNRQRGRDVFFLTGTDEHGQKVLKAAQEKGVTAQEFVDSIIPSFKEMWKKLNISYDDFIRTTDKRHVDTVQKVLKILHEKGDLYMGEYEGLYCVPCEVFWNEKQAPDNLCPDCRRPVELIKETNFFFKISKYQEWLLSYIKDNKDFIRPESRRNEVLSFLQENKMNDLCISRPKSRLSWGISLPFSEDHVTYVWFDALINYISALGFSEGSEKFKKFWPNAIHLMGKDIIRQHAVFWPVMLKSLGLSLPKMIFAHGWWQVDKEKMSKSRGNVVDPVEVIDEFGIDAYRYFLLRDVPFGLDGVFSRDALINRLNADLANDLGNLVYRTLTMTEKYFEGRIPKVNRDSADEFVEKNIFPKMKTLSGDVDRSLNELNFIAALEFIWGLIASCNKYIEEAKPWNLKKENKTAQLENFIAVLLDAIRLIAEEIAPFMPDTAEKIKEQIKGGLVTKGAPLFPRIDLS